MMQDEQRCDGERLAGRMTAVAAVGFVLFIPPLLSTFDHGSTLFGVAHHGDRRADAARSLIDNGTVYALSSAVYCTSWTYYGSVGRAATSGVGFLAIWRHPALMPTSELGEVPSTHYEVRNELELRGRS
jgi:hypothetical protein